MRELKRKSCLQLNRDIFLYSHRLFSTFSFNSNLVSRQATLQLHKTQSILAFLSEDTGERGGIKNKSDCIFIFIF